MIRHRHLYLLDKGVPLLLPGQRPKNIAKQRKICTIARGPVCALLSRSCIPVESLVVSPGARASLRYLRTSLKGKAGSPKVQRDGREGLLHQMGQGMTTQAMVQRTEGVSTRVIHSTHGVM